MKECEGEESLKTWFTQTFGDNLVEIIFTILYVLTMLLLTVAKIAVFGVIAYFFIKLLFS